MTMPNTTAAHPHLIAPQPELVALGKGTRPRDPDYRTIPKASREHGRLLAMAGFAWCILPQVAPVSKPFLRAMAAANDLGAAGQHDWSAQGAGTLYNGKAMAAMLNTCRDVTLRFNVMGNVLEIAYRGVVWATLPGQYMDGIPSSMTPKPAAFDPFSGADWVTPQVDQNNGHSVAVELEVSGADGKGVAGMLANDHMTIMTDELGDARQVAAYTWGNIRLAPSHVLGRLELTARYKHIGEDQPFCTEFFTPITSADYQTFGGGTPWELAQAKARARFMLDTQRASQTESGTHVVYCYPGAAGVRDDTYSRVVNAPVAYRPAYAAMPIAWVRDGQTLQARPIKGGQDTLDMAQRYAVKQSQEAHNRGVTFRVLEFMPADGSPRQFVALADGAARTLTVAPGTAPAERMAYRDGLSVPRFDRQPMADEPERQVAEVVMPAFVAMADYETTPAQLDAPAAVAEVGMPAFVANDNEPTEDPGPFIAQKASEMGTAFAQEADRRLSMTLNIDPSTVAAFESVRAKLEASHNIAKAVRRFLSGNATTRDLSDALSAHEVAHD